jgi:hypothetical protein
LAGLAGKRWAGERGSYTVVSDIATESIAEQAYTACENSLFKVEIRFF